jgi:hypothetical protein
MKEGFPMPEQKIDKTERIRLANELREKTEGFPFEGLEDGVLEELKAVDEEYPGYTTPIDVLVERLASKGMKVVLGDDPESGNIFILPLDSDDVVMDSVLPRHLKVSDAMDSGLRKLILSHKEAFESSRKK